MSSANIQHHDRGKRDLVRGKVVRVADADDLWVRPDYFAPWNVYQYEHFPMLKVRLYGVNGVERGHPHWHAAVRDLEDRVLARRVDLEVHTFDYSTERYIGRVWLREDGRRGQEVTVDPKYRKTHAGKHGTEASASGAGISKSSGGGFRRVASRSAARRPSGSCGSRQEEPAEAPVMVKVVVVSALSVLIALGVNALFDGQKPTPSGI